VPFVGSHQLSVLFFTPSSGFKSRINPAKTPPDARGDPFPKIAPKPRTRQCHAKDLVAIRISPRLMQQLRRQTKQALPTMIHEMLEEVVKKEDA